MLAPGKVNLCLLVGAPRADGLHPLVSSSSRTSSADKLTLGARGGARRTSSSAPASRATTSPPARCASSARATGWDGPPQRLTIAKRIPIAAGMAGGSSDAAAALRLISRASGVADPARSCRCSSAPTSP